MSDRDQRTGNSPVQDAEENFLSRWARLKRESRERDTDLPVPPARAAGEAESAGAEDAEDATEYAKDAEDAAPEEGSLELPPIESLTSESDFGPFMRPGVDPALRRLALRKLWSNPKYNVIDELDPYRWDYKSFTALGDIITSDMKFHAERLLREQLEKAAQAAENEGADGASDALPATESSSGEQPAERSAADAAPDREAANDDDDLMENTDERRNS